MTRLSKWSWPTSPKTAGKGEEGATVGPEDFSSDDRIATVAAEEGLLLDDQDTALLVRDTRGRARKLFRAGHLAEAASSLDESHGLLLGPGDALADTNRAIHDVVQGRARIPFRENRHILGVSDQSNESSDPIEFLRGLFLEEGEYLGWCEA